MLGVTMIYNGFGLVHQSQSPEGDVVHWFMIHHPN